MKTRVLFLTLLLFAGAAPTWAQEAKASTTVAELIEQLGDPEYAIRQRAEKALVAHGKKALVALRKTAGKHDDPEVQWRAAKIQRQIEAGASKPKGLERRPRGSTGRPADPERAPVSPRRGVRGDSPSDSPRFERMRDPWTRFRGQRGVSPEIDRMLERMREQMKGGTAPFPGASSNRSTQIQTGPDGVKVRVTGPGKDGKQETRLYQAKDMESFRKKFPGVLTESGLEIGGGLNLFGRGSRRRGNGVDPFKFLESRMRRVESGDAGSGGRTLRPRNGLDPVHPTGRKLGVYLGEVNPAVRDYLSLETGMMVQDVQANSLADKLGIESKDIVTQVGKRTVRSVADVAAGLDGVEDAAVTVKVYRRGRELTLKMQAKVK